jgi:hypothetical protein
MDETLCSWLSSTSRILPARDGWTRATVENLVFYAGMAVPRVTANNRGGSALFLSNLQRVPVDRRPRTLRIWRSGQIQKLTQRFRLTDDRPAIFQFQNTATLPVPQAAVDVLPGSASHCRQLTL